MKTDKQINEQMQKLRLVQVGASMITDLDPACDCGAFNNASDYAPWCRLLGSINIGQTFHHVEFILVDPKREGQLAACEHQRERLEAIKRLDDPGEFKTVEIPSLKGEYICMVLPFQT